MNSDAEPAMGRWCQWWWWYIAGKGDSDGDNELFQLEITVADLRGVSLKSLLSTILIKLHN